MPSRTTGASCWLPGIILGPVDYVAVLLPEGETGDQGFRQLLDLVETQSVFVIDLEFVTRSEDGSLTTVQLDSLDPRLAELDGADTGLLDRDDLEQVAGDLRTGDMLAVLAYEDRTLTPVVDAWEQAGARLVAEGPVALEDLKQALVQPEPAAEVGGE